MGRVEKNLYWVTDGTYQAAFLTTCEGVSNKVTHIVYSHHHADHLGASSLFGRDVVRVGQIETKKLLASENDPARPLPDVTFDTDCALRVGGERVDLAWHGTNHTPTTSTSTSPTMTRSCWSISICLAGCRSTASN